MAHEIDTTARPEGAAAYAGKPAWHTLGRVLDSPPDSETMIREAGLDWKVRLVPAQYQTPELVSETGVEPAALREMTDHKVVFRDDTGAALGIVKSRYVPVQNRDAFSFCDGLIREGEMKYEAAGSLKDGKHIWALARVAEHAEEIVKGDTILPYVLFTTAHDGTGAVHVQPTEVRVVCWNTLSLARGASERQWSIRHTGDTSGKLAKLQTLVASALELHTEHVEMARELASRTLTSTEFNEYVETLFPPRASDNVVTGRIRNARAAIHHAFTSDARQRTAPDSAWAAYNAVTQWHQHDRWDSGRNAQTEKRLASVLTGDAAGSSATAWDTAVEMFTA